MSYVAPENALKNAMELKEQGNFEGALEELHLVLHGKKFRGNNLILERIIIEMIDLCGENLVTTYLKEDIGHFRNVCQHTNMGLLENVLKKLKDIADEIIKKAESNGGDQRLIELLGGSSDEDPSKSAVGAFLSGDTTELNPEELMLLANCNYQAVEEKQNLMASVTFFIEVCKIILDTLRQNSKMIDFYNQTATRVFDFCAKYKYRLEYIRVAETLHNHFNQILKQSKHPELLILSKIPFPIKLDEEDALQKVLELRYHQLKIALQMKIWSDAFRTTENIYQLINRQKHHASRMKQILSDFFANLAEIFWQSEFYLFHAYAIMNLQQIIKFNKTMTDQQKAQMTAQLVIAVLSVPLNNRLSNFERLNVQYSPPGMDKLQESASTKQELFNIANMLQVKGIPSRASLLNYVRIKNLHLSPEFPHIQELFRLIEDEESPFTISKAGKVILEKLDAHKEWYQYREFLMKTLSVRILQKCRNYFKNLKMSTLKSLLGFYQHFNQIELLLYECNREGLIQTIINHETQSVTFDQEIEVQNNLLKFGFKLKDAFIKVQDVTSEGKERERIFLKVKEKMEQEMSEVLKRKVDMERMKEEIARTQAEETRTLQDIFLAQQQEREKSFAVQQIKEEKERQKNKLLEELELMRKIRAQEVLAELSRRGIKKIGQAKISDMEKRGEIDYDEVMGFYQSILKKEKEAFEGEKQKKIKDVEYWARAVREEEKVATEKYAKEHGDEEMKQIQQAVRERHEKELKMKQSLEKAQDVFSRFKGQVMQQRRDAHEALMQQFIKKKGEELQQKIIEEAKAELRKVENIRKVKERELALKKQAEEREKKQRAEGKFEEPETETGGWGRGTAKQPVISDSAPKRGGGGDDNGFLNRQAMGTTKPEEKKGGDEGPKRPTFTRQQKSQQDSAPDTGFSRGTFGGAAPKKDDSKATTLSATSSAPPKEEKKETLGPWRSSGPQQKQEEQKFGPIRSAPTTAPKQSEKKNEKGDDSWSFSGGSGRKK